MRITQAILLSSGQGDALLEIGEKRKLNTHGMKGGGAWDGAEFVTQQDGDWRCVDPPKAAITFTALTSFTPAPQRQGHLSPRCWKADGWGTPHTCGKTTVSFSQQISYSH